MVIVNGWSPIRASFADAALLAAVNVFLRKLEQWHRDRNPQHHSESKDKLRRLLMQRVPTEFVPTELVQAELPAIPDKYCSTTLEHWGTLTKALHIEGRALLDAACSERSCIGKPGIRDASGKRVGRLTKIFVAQPTWATGLARLRA